MHNKRKNTKELQELLSQGYALVQQFMIPRVGRQMNYCDVFYCSEKALVLIILNTEPSIAALHNEWGRHSCTWILAEAPVRCQSNSMPNPFVSHLRSKRLAMTSYGPGWLLCSRSYAEAACTFRPRKRRCCCQCQKAGRKTWEPSCSNCIILDAYWLCVTRRWRMQRPSHSTFRQPWNNKQLWNPCCFYGAPRHSPAFSHNYCKPIENEAAICRFACLNSVLPAMQQCLLSHNFTYFAIQNRSVRITSLHQ
jgi:hypothetical protein